VHNDYEQDFWYFAMLFFSTSLLLSLLVIEKGSLTFNPLLLNPLTRPLQKTGGAPSGAVLTSIEAINLTKDQRPDIKPRIGYHSG
jgi:hypothetical protein